VRVFFYLEDRERTLHTPTDKIMLSLTAFADELEREKACQRTRDAMVRKARAGPCFFELWLWYGRGQSGRRQVGCGSVRSSR
jgi:hypothetical protein